MLAWAAVTLPALVFAAAKTTDVLFHGRSAFGLPVNLTTVCWLFGLGAIVCAVGRAVRARPTAPDRCGAAFHTDLKRGALHAPYRGWLGLAPAATLVSVGAVVLVAALWAFSRAPPAALELPPEAARAGVWERFRELDADRLHLVRPADDPLLPWTALLLGLWISSWYSWGASPGLIGPAAAARSAADGQKALVLAAALRLLSPLILVVPGLVAFDLYGEQMRAEAARNINRPTLARFREARAHPVTARTAYSFDEAFARLYPSQAADLLEFNAQAARVAIPVGEPVWAGNRRALQAVSQNNRLVPPEQRVVVQPELVGFQYDSAFGLLLAKPLGPGLSGVLWAALLAALLAAAVGVLEAASRTFAADVFQPGLRRGATPRTLAAVRLGTIAACGMAASAIAPGLGDPRFHGLFGFIQEFQGFVSPGMAGALVFGLFVRLAPRSCGLTAMLAGPAAYGALWLAAPELAFFNRIALATLAVFAVLSAMTLAYPRRQDEDLARPGPAAPGKRDLPGREHFGATTLGGALVVLAAAALYIIFW
jgi:SSS family solute:Na+ symporter